MGKFTLPILALLVAGVSAGVVSPTTRCGGVGTPLQLRISDCEGRCTFVAGKPYDCEEDFMPSSAAPSLSLRMDVCLDMGLCYTIFEVVLANSSVQPGFTYTAKYQVVPNDILRGETVRIQAFIYQTANFRIETCLEIEATIS